MTAFLDLRFTSASGWTDSEKALTLDYDGAAQTNVPASTLSPEMVLSGADLTLDPGVVITGIQLRFNASCNTVSSVTPIFFTSTLRLGSRSKQGFTPGTTFGPIGASSNEPPSVFTTFGGEGNTIGFGTCQGAQINEKLEYTFAVFNGTSGARLLSLWGAGVRLWLDAPSMQDVVERAYRKLAILSKDTTIEADDLAHGTMLLNDMLFGWEIYGVDIGHVERQAGEAFPLDRKYIEGTAQQLAERLSPDYQVPAGSADAFFRQLMADYLTIDAQEMPSTLRLTPSQRRYFEP